MILQVCYYFLLESNKAVFSHHELSSNVVENDHQTKLIKRTADKYFTMRLFTYAKNYSETVVMVIDVFSVHACGRNNINN